MEEKKILTLRAHHGMCLAFFQGKGYSGTFTEHMSRILQQLEADPARRIRLAASADDICAACPNLQQGVCESAEKTERYDRETLQYCELREGTELSWQEFSGRVRTNILQAGRRPQICGDCQWDELCRP